MAKHTLKEWLDGGSFSFKKLNTEEMARLAEDLGHQPIEFADPPKCQPKKKRIRQSSKPLMNKLEDEFLRQYLSHDSRSFIMAQAIRFRLGNGIWYKPDFVVMYTDRPVTCFEVKGPKSWRGGFENLKVAAGLYPVITWRLAWKESDKWFDQVVLP